MRPLAIPAELHGFVLAKAGSGKGSVDIARALQTEHGLKVSAKTVERLLRRIRKVRAEVTKAVVREALAPGLTRDIQRLEQLVRKTMRRIPGAADDFAYCKLVEQVRKLVETKLHYSGADQPDDSGMTADVAKARALANQFFGGAVAPNGDGVCESGEAGPRPGSAVS